MVHKAFLGDDVGMTVWSSHGFSFGRIEKCHRFEAALQLIRELGVERNNCELYNVALERRRVGEGLHLRPGFLLLQFALPKLLSANLNLRRLIRARG